MTKQNLLEETLTHSIIGAFYEVYNSLGFGFLEQLYVSALERELIARGHRVSREMSVNVLYKGDLLGSQRLDMVVDDLVVIEAKSSETLAPFAPRQLYNYLHATNLEIGLLLHFGPKARFIRVVCTNQRNQRQVQPSASSAPIRHMS